MALDISTTEAEYVSSRTACQQALWMRQALVDYNIKFNDIPILYDNKGAINLNQNIFIGRTVHTRTKQSGESVNKEPFQMKLNEILPQFKKWEEMLHENVLCLTGNKDHPNVFSYLIYCLATEQPFNLTYYMVKRMASTTKHNNMVLPYGMLLTRLFRQVASTQPNLMTPNYTLTSHVIVPLIEERECMTKSSTKDLFTPFKESERVLHSTRRLIKTTSLDYSSLPEFDLFSDLENQSEEEVTEAMGEPTMEEYMIKTRDDYRSGIARPKIDEKDHFELKGQFLKELHDNTFSGPDSKDANEHIKKVLKIVNLFHIPDVTENQIMLQFFLMSLTGAASRWLRNEPAGSIDT
ncbi:hypothetical protein Tco_0127042 [Tanacetum coccineum]